MAQEYDNRKIANRHVPPEKRFLLLVEKLANDGCWIWQGSPAGSNGYGRIMVDGVNIQAHRYSYIKHIGEIPDGVYVLHKCDTPLCVNPNHLFLGSHQDNSDDKVKKNRQANGLRLSKAQNNQIRCGEKNVNSKLKSENVISIFKDERPQRVIAKDYNVTQTLINSIKKQRSWKWLTTTI